MSKFFLKITDVFKDQEKEKDFDKEKLNKDKTFFFDDKTDQKDFEKNCLLTNDCSYDRIIEKNNIKKSRKLIYASLSEEILEKWEKNKYTFMKQKFDNSISKLRELYSKFNTDNKNISDSEIQKEFKENNNFKKFCFVNKYTKENDEKTYLKYFNEIFEYKSLREIKRKFVIFKNELNCTYLKQTILGDCYFLEVLSTLSNCGQLIYQLFPNEEMPEDGIFTVCLFVDGKWQKVFIDDYFFFKKGTDKFAFVQPRDNCIYSCILEKAYAKVKGSFSALIGGYSENAFKVLTGFDCINILFEKSFNDEEFIKFIKEKFDIGYLFSCCTDAHAYSLLNIFIDKDIKKTCLQIRNPWGDNYNDKESENANKILLDKGDIYKEPTMNEYNGIFQCTYPEFKNKFCEVIICQTLFNSTIYSYPVDFQKITNCAYFKLEVLEDTLFGITMHKKNTINYKGSIKHDFGQDDTNKSNDDKIKNDYTLIVIGNNVNEEISSNSKCIDFKNLENYYSIKLGRYFIKIEAQNKDEKQDMNIILNIIIKGNQCKAYYLGEDEKGDNLNNTIPYTRYIYGERTGLLFDQYKELKKFVEEYHKINILENGKGYYIETIFTNEVKTLVFTQKKTLEEYIASLEVGNGSILFTGKNHINGKICGKGAIKDIKNNRIVQVILKENKIFSFELNIDDKNDVSKLIMTLKLYSDIIDKNGEHCYKEYIDEDNLYLKFDETDWTCSICRIKKDKKEDYLYCKRCDFYLCLNCFHSYQEIINDSIEEVHIGFESQYFGQAATNFLFAIPRFILPMNPITHKTFILASIYLKTYSNRGIVIEFGNFKGNPIKVKDQEYSTYYWTNKKNGIRFAEMSYEDYKEKKLDNAKESNRIFKLKPKKSISIKDALLLCNEGENSEKWNSTEYNQFYKNSKDFVASFIRVTQSSRGKGECLRGAHNSSSVVIPKVILDEIEANEKDYVQNFFGKVPLVGYMIDAYNLTSNIKNYIGDNKDK